MQPRLRRVAAFAIVVNLFFVYKLALVFSNGANAHDLALWTLSETTFVALGAIFFVVLRSKWH